MTTRELRVAHLDCEHDAARLRRAIENVPGVNVVKILPHAGRLSVEIDEERTSLDTLSAHLRQSGFPISESPKQGPPPPWQNPKVLTSVASGVLLLIGWGLSYSGIPQVVIAAVFAGSAISGAYYFGREALEELIQERTIGIELLMSIAATIAFALGQWGEAAMLCFLYSISEALEGYTEAKTRGAIQALMKLTPKLATLLKEGRELVVPVEELLVGDLFRVKPGEALATDGEVVSGVSSVNQAPVTGESVPVEKEAGDSVFAGSINGEGSLDVRVTKLFAENTVSRIIQMVEEAQEHKGKSHRFIERFGSRYSPAVLGGGILIALAAVLVLGLPWADALTRATVFVVAAAPCALVISIPITLVATLGTGARKGVLIKGGVFVEELARVNVVALDKTGTITRGEPDVTDIIVRPVVGLSEEQFLAVASAIERRSQHPLAQAIMRRAGHQSLVALEASDFQSLTGIGATARVDGEQIYAAKPGYFVESLGLSMSDLQPDIDRLQGQGKTVVVLGTSKIIWGLIAIRDNIRANSAAAIRALHAQGIRVVMLTGDNERAAQAIAREAGIDEVFADLKPEDKAERVRELEKRFGHVAMVGDGVNDAPALAEAAVGVAMGAAGTDVALETADLALMGDDLEKLVFAVALARRNRNIVRQNLFLSGVVIAVLMIGAVSGLFSLPIAVVGHELSELIVIANGLRMLRA